VFCPEGCVQQSEDGFFKAIWIIVRDVVFVPTNVGPAQITIVEEK